VFVKYGEGVFGCFASGAELIEATIAVEVLDGGGVGAVGGIVEIAPSAELGEGRGDGLEVAIEEERESRIFGRGGGGEGGVDLGGTKGDDKAGALGDEVREDGAIEAGFLRVEMRKDREIRGSVHGGRGVGRGGWSARLAECLGQAEAQILGVKVGDAALGLFGAGNGPHGSLITVDQGGFPGDIEGE
jgi:hypothetical protein